MVRSCNVSRSTGSRQDSKLFDKNRSRVWAIRWKFSRHSRILSGEQFSGVRLSRYVCSFLLRRWGPMSTSRNVRLSLSKTEWRCGKARGSGMSDSGVSMPLRNVFRCLAGGREGDNRDDILQVLGNDAIWSVVLDSGEGSISTTISSYMN